MALASFLAAPLSAVGATLSASSGSSESGSSGGDAGVGVGYVFGSQTLMPGQQVTVSGEVMSLASDGSSVVMVAATSTTGGGGGAGTSTNGGGNGAGNGAGATKTEGISALINGAQSSSSTTQSSGKQTQTQNAAMRGKYTGHERLCWMGTALVGLWGVGFALL